MAFSGAEIEQFIEALHADATLRDRVRDAILADDFLALPGIVRQLGERIDALTIRMDQLTIRMDHLAARMEQVEVQVAALVGESRKMQGQIGNLEGGQYELRWQLNLGSHLGTRFRRIVPLMLANTDWALEALDGGAIEQAEWADLMRLDAVALAREGRGPDAPEVVVAIEISKVVDSSDVERAHRRAAIIAKAGRAVRACVGGQAITMGAEQLAARLGVIALIDQTSLAA